MHNAHVQQLGDRRSASHHATGHNLHPRIEVPALEPQRYRAKATMATAHEAYTQPTLAAR